MVHISTVKYNKINFELAENSGLSDLQFSQYLYTFGNEPFNNCYNRKILNFDSIKVTKEHVINLEGILCYNKCCEVNCADRIRNFINFRV